MLNKTQDVQALSKMADRALIQLYEGEKFKQELLEGILKLGEGKDPQPLENFEMRLYYNNRVVTLVKQDDKEPAIWFKHPETGSRSWQPVYLYKHKTTGKWTRW